MTEIRLGPADLAEILAAADLPLPSSIVDSFLQQPVTHEEEVASALVVVAHLLRNGRYDEESWKTVAREVKRLGIPQEQVKAVMAEVQQGLSQQDEDPIAAEVHDLFSCDTDVCTLCERAARMGKLPTPLELEDEPELTAIE